MTTTKGKIAPKKVRTVRRSVADQVYENVKQDIAEFRLIPGDRFTENELSLRLKVSRTPVRQSLYRLQQEGYVEVLFRSGWRVLPFDFDKFEQLYDLVAPQDRSDDTVQVSQWDEQFHCALVEAAGNMEIARVHKEVTDRIRIIRRLDFTKQARIDATYEEHAKILKAIQRKRSDQATLLLRAHIETSQAEVRKITLHQVFMARQAK
jgi:DNA-binding GntR family transcriptional regulator